MLEELATLGLDYSEKDKIEILLASLSELYEAIIQALRNLHIIIQDVIFKILHEDLRRKKIGKSTNYSKVSTTL